MSYGGKMSKTKFWKTALLGSAFTALTAAPAFAADVNVRAGDLGSALDTFIDQTGMHVFYSAKDIKGIYTKGVKGSLSTDAALDQLLSDTGFVSHRDGAVIEIVKGHSSSAAEVMPMQLAQAAPARTAVETVTVTSSKLGGADVQSIPIAITALSQEQLTATQTAGGPDLVKQVPNLTFTKTNFSGYSIQIRGIGTQAISVTTDPAVAVAFNDIPFIRNHFFEQEFFDVSQVAILRGPQGTLYGRNATAGVVNLTTARPTDQFEAMASAEFGNYKQRRFEGMLNLPIVDDRLEIRLAGEWTKRQGYSFNELTDRRIDGRDLWSGRMTIGLKPTENVQMFFIWEHFQENDDRIRSGKQLCKRDPGPAELNGVPTDSITGDASLGFPGYRNDLSQGCLPSSLYAPESFQVPNGFSLSFIRAPQFFQGIDGSKDPYASAIQSPNLRVIQSTLDPTYRAKNDTVVLNTDYKPSPSLTLTSQTGFGNDFLYSTQDYNRFNTAPGIFSPSGTPDSYPSGSAISRRSQISDEGIFCDPQLGCTDRLVGQDLSEERSWQLSQEFRLSSSFDGPFNFSAGANYLHYETEENYYVFINALTWLATVDSFVYRPPYVGGVTDNLDCLGGLIYNSGNFSPLGCVYIDPNPIDRLNGNGHNYFVSKNPYVLNSYATFGEANYSIFKDLKLTGGLRWTEDQKHFSTMPSQLLIGGWGTPITGAVNQQWGQITGRVNITWTPKLDLTDQTLAYGSYAHGYKAGGANPPGAQLLVYTPSDISQPTHPVTFKPEFVDAFEIGTKNTLFDGELTLNGSAFYYNYENYQISYIIDRTSVNLNFDAHVTGAEAEATWEPSPGLRFNFAGGWQNAVLAEGQQAIDLMDRTAGHSDWVVVKPAYTQASNCIMPEYVAATGLPQTFAGRNGCGTAYIDHLDPVTCLPYNPVTLPNSSICGGRDADYIGFDPSTAPNNGEGFAKNVGGNKLPNAPPLTVSAGAQYSTPLSGDWAATLRGDYYWQDYSWARVWNDNPYDRLRGYTNINLALIFTSQSGWQVMLYDKNVFNTMAITGTFLNSDDSGLTTNVFLTDPKLIGIRITKNW
jgi:outer membrane receptor protein involved in Fe transport